MIGQNHPRGNILPSNEDTEVTTRLADAGKIIGIERLDHKLRWFVNTLQNEFSIRVEVNEIGVEATELGMDDVEDFFVPSNYLMYFQKH